jgi:hypothetical protein
MLYSCILRHFYSSFLSLPFLPCILCPPPSTFPQSSKGLLSPPHINPANDPASSYYAAPCPHHPTRRVTHHALMPISTLKFQAVSRALSTPPCSPILALVLDLGLVFGPDRGHNYDHYGSPDYFFSFPGSSHLSSALAPDSVLARRYGVEQQTQSYYALMQESS